MKNYCSALILVIGILFALITLTPAWAGEKDDQVKNLKKSLVIESYRFGYQSHECDAGVMALANEIKTLAENDPKFQRFLQAKPVLLKDALLLVYDSCLAGSRDNISGENNLPHLLLKLDLASK